MGRAVVSAPITLGMLVMLFLCLSLQNLWRTSFGPFLHWLSGLGIKAGHGIFRIDIHPFRAAEEIDVEVQKVLSQGIAMAEKNFVRFLNYTVEPFLLIAGVTLALGLTAYEGFDALWHHVTKVAPRVIHQTIVRPVQKAGQVVDSRLTARVNSLTHRLEAIAAQVRHTAVAIPHDIATVPERVGITSKQMRRLARRTHELEKKTVGLGAVTLVTAALVRMGFRWVKCASAQRVGRRLNCGSFRFLESLLSLAIDTLVITHLCATTKLLTRLAYDVLPLVSALTRGVEKLMECQGATRAPNMKLNAAALPALDKSLIKL